MSFPIPNYATRHPPLPCHPPKPFPHWLGMLMFLPLAAVMIAIIPLMTVAVIVWDFIGSFASAYREDSDA